MVNVKILFLAIVLFVISENVFAQGAAPINHYEVGGAAGYTEGKMIDAKAGITRDPCDDSCAPKCY